VYFVLSKKLFTVLGSLTTAFIAGVMIQEIYVFIMYYFFFFWIILGMLTTAFIAVVMIKEG